MTVDEAKYQLSLAEKAVLQAQHLRSRAHTQLEECLANERISCKCGADIRRKDLTIVKRSSGRWFDSYDNEHSHVHYLWVCDKCDTINEVEESDAKYAQVTHEWDSDRYRPSNAVEALFRAAWAKEEKHAKEKARQRAIDEAVKVLEDAGWHIDGGKLQALKDRTTKSDG